MSLTTAAVQHDFYRLCVDGNLLSKFDVGRLRHIDAGRRIVNILVDTETDHRVLQNEDQLILEAVS